MLFQENTLNPKGVILYNGEGEDLNDFSRNNDLLKSGLFSDYNILYFNILNFGNSSFQNCSRIIGYTYSNPYSDFSINDRLFFLLQNDKQVNGFSFSPLKEDISYKGSKSYSIQRLDSLKMELDKLASKHRYYVIDPKSDTAIAQYKRNYNRNFSIGLFYGPNILFGSRLNTNKSAIGSCGINLSKNISSNFALKADLFASWKIPNQKSIQSGMQGKVMDAVQNNEDYLYIDEKLSGHVFFGAELSARYFFFQKQHTRFFASIGFGLSSIMNLNINLVDTIDISGVDMSDPSSMQSAIGGDIGGNQNSGDNKGNQSSLSTSFFEFGAETRLSPGAKFGLSIPFRLYNNTKTNEKTFSTALNFNLSFILNPRKFKK